MLRLAGAAEVPKQVTFSKDVAPILQARCQSCHEPGSIAPMSLRTFQETRDGESLMQTTAIAHLGGATLDNEENYLIKKLFTGGLGMVCISNQARI